MAFVAGSGLVFLLTAFLGESAMNDWGWRIPFLIAGPLGWVGLYLRTQLEDSPEFLEAKKQGQTDATPLRSAVTHAWAALLFCVGFVVIKAVGHWTLQTLCLVIFQRNCTTRSWTPMPSPQSACFRLRYWCPLWAIYPINMAVSR
jgi:MFS family permease